jgi:uncharacterized membrane protein
MAKAKRITRTRGGAPGVERTEGEHGREGKSGTSDLLRRALSPKQGAACGASRRQRGLWKPVRSFVSTAFYKLYGELAGLVESRPALGRNILISALTALGAKAPRVSASVTIGKSREEVLGVLLDFEEVRRFLNSIQRVEIAKGQDTARFTFCADAGKGPARTGVMSFAPAPGGRGTEIRAVLAGTQSAGRVARAIAKLLAEAPKERLRGDLRRLQQWMETGEIPTVTGQPSGRKAT